MNHQITQLKCNSTTIISTFLICIMTTGWLSAQSTASLISPSSLGDSNLTLSQANLKQKFLALPTTLSLDLIVVNDLFQALNNGVLPVQIPNDTKIHSFNVNYVRTSPNGDYTWFGEFGSVEYCEDTVATDCSEGNIMIIKKDGKSFGEINIDSNYYQIKDLGDGLSALIELDATSLNSNECYSPLLQLFQE